MAMASNGYRSFSILLFCFIFITSVTCSARFIALPSDSEKVALDLYYESLCPYSANFIANYLADVFENGLIDIVDLKLFPWGNAKITTNGTFRCQHGPYECVLDTIEACAIHVWPDLNKYFPFINCVESLVYEHKYSQWETCFEKLGFDPKPIADCYTSGLGTEFELEYAAETNSLQPPHEYVPWVVVDGQPLYEDYENFVSYICKAYKGHTLHSACSELLKTKVAHMAPVCRAAETENANLLKRIKSTLKSWAPQVIKSALA